MIPLAVPSISEREKQNVRRAVDSTWISSSGEFLDRFEARFPEIVTGTGSCLAVINGTAALHLALAALGVGPGDEVIVPSLTYVAAANAVRYVGATPVLADIDPLTWCVHPEVVADLVGPRTVGVIAVHLYGHPAELDRLIDLTTRYGLWLVEDAAEAPLATYRDRPVGAVGTVGTFSFYGNKILSSGEGGAVVTRDKQLLDRMRLLRGQGMDPKRRYYFPVVGYNFRMTNLTAALLCGQLDRCTELLAARRGVYARYDEGLAAASGVTLQPVAPWARLAPWLYSILVDGRDQLAQRLHIAGVETRPFFIPMHLLPAFADVRRSDMTVTEKLAHSGLNLPTFPGLSLSDQQYVIEQVLEAVIE